MDEIKKFILKRFNDYEMSFVYSSDRSKMEAIIIQQHSEYPFYRNPYEDIDKGGIIICSKQLYDKYYSDRTQYEFFDEQILQWFINVKGEEETFEVLDYFLQRGQ